MMAIIGRVSFMSAGSDSLSTPERNVFILGSNLIVAKQTPSFSSSLAAINVVFHISHHAIIETRIEQHTKNTAKGANEILLNT